MKRLFKNLLSLFATIATLSAFYVPVGASNCSVFVRHVTNNSDSAVGGGYWANDTFDSTYTVCSTDTPGVFNVSRHDTGSFVSWSGDSPNATGTIGDGVTGSIDGHWTIVVTGATLNASTPGDLGTVDYQCDQMGNCTIPPSVFTQIFTSYGSATYNEDWIWVYTACDGSQWINSAAGNSGDITLPGNCTGSSTPSGYGCGDSWDTYYRVVYKDGVFKFWNNHKFCRDQWFPGYAWWWKAHPELMPGH